MPGSMGFSKAGILEWVAISFSSGSSGPGIEPTFPALAGGFFLPLSHLGSHTWIHFVLFACCMYYSIIPWSLCNLFHIAVHKLRSNRFKGNFSNINLTNILNFNMLYFLRKCNDSLVAQMIKRLPATRETRVWSLGWEDPLEKEMATRSSILAWRIPWTEEPGGLQSMGSQRVGHDWATSLQFFHFKWLFLHIECETVIW